MKKLGFPVCLMLVVGVALGSCDKLKEVAEQAVKQATDSNPAREMLAHYANGYNEVLNRFPGLIKEYVGDIPLDQVPSAELRISLFSAGPVDMSLKTITDSFNAAAKVAPDKYKHLQPMADELLITCKELAAVYRDADKYYEAEDYKDDDYAGGKEIHGRMKVAVEKYQKAMRTFDAALSGEEDKLMKAELAQYTDDKDYGYWIRFVPHEAKKTLAIVQSPKTDVAGASKAVEDFITVYNNVKVFADGKPELNQAFKGLVDQAGTFVGTLKRFRRAIQAEQQDSDEINRELDRIVTDYNNLIGLQNSLFQLESYGQLK